MRIILIALLFFTIAGPPITVPATTLNAFRGSDYPIRVKLETRLGVPITNATLFFFHETDNTLLGSALTNQSGYAMFLWQIPQNHELGPVLLNATFYGDPEKYLLPCSVKIPITVFAQMEIVVEMYGEDEAPIGSVVYPNQEIIFKVIIRDDLMYPLEGITVNLLDNNHQKLAESITAKNGSTTFAYKLQSPQNSNIEYTIQSGNSGYYTGTEYNLQFTIGNSSTSFVGVPAFIRPVEGVLITGRLCLQTGFTIPNATITFLLDGTSFIENVLTDTEGNFAFSLPDTIHELNDGQHLLLKYEGSIGYDPTQAIVGFLPTTANTPFFHSIDFDVQLGYSPLLLPIGLVALCSITISSVILRRKINRTTKYFVSH